MGSCVSLPSHLADPEAYLKLNQRTRFNNNFRNGPQAWQNELLHCISNSPSTQYSESSRLISLSNVGKKPQDPHSGPPEFLNRFQRPQRKTRVRDNDLPRPDRK